MQKSAWSMVSDWPQCLTNQYNVKKLKSQIHILLQIKCSKLFFTTTLATTHPEPETGPMHTPPSTWLTQTEYDIINSRFDRTVIQIVRHHVIPKQNLNQCLKGSLTDCFVESLNAIWILKIANYFQHPTNSAWSVCFPLCGNFHVSHDQYWTLMWYCCYVQKCIGVMPQLVLSLHKFLCDVCMFLHN